AAKGRQAGSEGCSSFRTVRDIGVEPGELANELAGMAEHMKRLSDRIEDVALAVEQERESNAKSMESYRQLKALLKSLQGEGE
ncbi:hypothetical protein JTM35_33485, partial [Pseudomonas aeruginosa]|nr:hypothetical protein [Pseudomonas aeruginosa]